ncbi:MAG: FAD-binding oxidoreductase [Clostridiales bacterium]|nr:FAD-binding oxidoreductase [Clostridiales bacterium]
MINKANVVIVGGGISGVSIAYNLAKKGMKDIVVIEKNYLASGATGRCGAGVRGQWGAEMNCKIALASIKFYEKANEILDYKRDIDFKQGGYLILAYTDKGNEQFKKNIELQNRLGIPSRYLKPEEALDIVPYVNLDGIKGVTYCPIDGHINPFKATEAFALAATKLGVKIYKYTEVKDIIVEDGKVKKVVTDKGDIETNVVVNAAGGYSKSVAEMVGVDLPVYSERHQILVTEPVEDMQGPMVMSFSRNLYCQQTPEGSFVMGRTGENEPRDLRITSSWDFLDKMAKTITEVLPPIGELTVIRQWAGLYNMTEDRQPIYGTVKDVEGFYLATGFSGHGFMFAPMTGLLIAEQIMGEENSIDISALRIDRFEKGELVFEPSVV